MTQPRRVFVAHAREDKERVRALYKQIKRRGFSPWLDEEDLIPGHIWEIEIQKAIREAGAFIACLSQISVQKQGYVQTEFRLALTAYGEKPPGAIYFIPVRLDECEIPDLQIPNRGVSIRDFQWLDLWQEGGFERLIQALEKGLGTTGGAMLKPGTEEASSKKEGPMKNYYDWYNEIGYREFSQLRKGCRVLYEEHALFPDMDEPYYDRLEATRLPEKPFKVSPRGFVLISRNAWEWHDPRNRRRRIHLSSLDNVSDEGEIAFTDDHFLARDCIVDILPDEWFTSGTNLKPD